MAWVVGWMDRWWEGLGRPDPYTVIDVGAGDGSLAREVLGAGPECLTALRYVLVEPDGIDPDFTAHVVERAGVVRVELPALLFPPRPRPGPGGGSLAEFDDYGEYEDPDEPPPPATGIGPLVASLADLPRIEGPAAVLALGWIDRLPTDTFEFRDGRWWEVRLAAARVGAGSEDVLEEILVAVELPPSAAGTGSAGAMARDNAAAGVGAGAGAAGAGAGAAGAGAGAGAGAAGAGRGGDGARPRPRLEVLVGAAAWLSDALRTAEAGAVTIVAPWATGVSEVSTPAGADGLALEQLSRVRRPIDPAPEPTPWGESAATWRLG